MIRFPCPVCSARLASAEDLEGQVVVCTQCGGQLEVPEVTSGKTGVAQEAPLQFRVDAGSTTEMDMTPMVDVTFLLLIFFMVTAAFTLQKSFEVPTPEETNASQAKPLEELEEDPDYIIVRVDEFNTYHVSAVAWEDEQEAPSEQELLVRLREAREGDGLGGVPTRMMVIANGEARHERVVRALDTGTEVGMEDVKLMTVEEDS